MKHKTLKRHRRKRNQRGGQPGLLSALAATARMARSRLPAIRFPHISLQRFASTAVSAVPYNPMWATNGARVPEVALPTLTTQQLQDIIRGHKGTYPSGTRREGLIIIARNVLASKGRLDSEPSVSALPATTAVPTTLSPNMQAVLDKLSVNNLQKLLTQKIEVNKNTIVPATGQTLEEAMKPIEIEVQAMTDQIVPNANTVPETARETNAMLASGPSLSRAIKEVYYSLSEHQLAVANTYKNYFTKLGQFESLARDKYARLYPKLEKLEELTTITGENQKYLETLNIVVKQRNAQAYQADIYKLLEFIFSYTPKDKLENILTTFTPERIRNLRHALFRLYIQNPVFAKKAMDILFKDIIPRNRFNPGSIDGIITAMEVSPADILEFLQKESVKISDTMLKHEQESALAKAKGMGWFAARTYFLLITTGLGATALVLLASQRVYDLHSLSSYLTHISSQSGMTPFASALDDLTTTFKQSELGVFYEAVTNKLSLTVAQNEELKEVVEKAKQGYTDFTAPVRPKTVTEQIAEHYTTIKSSIHDSYRYFFPPAEAPPMNAVRPRTGRNLG